MLFPGEGELPERIDENKFFLLKSGIILAIFLALTEGEC